MGFVFGIEIRELELTHQFLINRFDEDHLVDSPLDTVAQYHPIDALIGGIIDRLFDMRVLQLKTDGLGLDQHGELPVKRYRQIAVSSANRELTGGRKGSGFK